VSAVATDGTAKLTFAVRDTGIGIAPNIRLGVQGIHTGRLTMSGATAEPVSASPSRSGWWRLMGGELAVRARWDAAAILILAHPARRDRAARAPQPVSGTSVADACSSSTTPDERRILARC